MQNSIDKDYTTYTLNPKPQPHRDSPGRELLAELNATCCRLACDTREARAAVDRGLNSKAKKLFRLLYVTMGYYGLLS